LEVEHDEQEIVQPVAALDIGKAELVCCVRVPGPGRRRCRKSGLLDDDPLVVGNPRLADQPQGDPGDPVAMGASSDYWRPPVRHEAPRNRVGMKGPCRWSVAAGR
jgi:transposase